MRSRRSGRSNPFRSAFKFISLFLALSGIAYAALTYLHFLNYVAAISSQLFLKALFNVESELILGGAFPVIKTPGLLAEIIDLCAGYIELAVLFGITFASFEKKMDYRIKGFLAGTLVMLLFNAIRISTTIYFYDAGAIEWYAAFHDFFFRAFLIIVIVTYYAIWYYYDLPRKAKRARNA